MQFYHEREQTGKNDGQNVQPEEKSSAQKGDIGVNSCAQGDKKSKERPGVKQNKENSNLRARLPPDNPATC